MGVARASFNLLMGLEHALTKLVELLASSSIGTICRNEANQAESDLFVRLLYGDHVSRTCDRINFVSAGGEGRQLCIREARWCLLRLWRGWLCLLHGLFLEALEHLENARCCHLDSRV